MTDFIEVVPGRVAYARGIIPTERTSGLLDALRDQATWSQERLRFGGENGVDVPFPRLVAWHGEPGIGYRYSGVSHQAAPWTPAMLEVRETLRALFPDVTMNGVLLNRYRGGLDSIGRHSDAEDDLVDGAPILGVSLGEARTMRLIPRGGRARDAIDLELEDGSLLLMHGDCQRTWTHGIAKQPLRTGERVSLTFRSVRV